MDNLFTISNITFVLGLFGIAFTIWNKVRDPIAKADTTDAILTTEIKQLKQDIITLKETITNLRDNHIHSLQLAIVSTNDNLNSLTLQVAKLSTIVEERLPRKAQ